MSSTVTVPQTELSVILNEIEERAKNGSRFSHPSVSLEWKLASAKDVPALVKALRKALRFIDWIDLSPALQKETQRAVSDITAILNQGRKNRHLSENVTESASGSEFPKSVSGRSQ